MESLFLIWSVAVIAAAHIIITSKLFIRYKASALLSYLIYTVLWDVTRVYVLYFLIFTDLYPKGSHLTHLLLSGILTIPLNGMTIFFFTDFMLKWIGKSYKILKLIFLLPFIVILITYTREALRRLALEPAPQYFQVAAPRAVHWLFFLIFFVVIGAYLSSFRIREPKKKKDVRTFSIVSALSLALYFALNKVSLAKHIGFNWDFSISTLIAILVNIPGFIILWRSFGRRHQCPADRIQSISLSRLGEKHGLSKREIEIAGLVIQGLANKEIKEQLHISMDTVKKHLYNIYKKTHVKSRLQLMNLFQYGNSIREDIPRE